jgi:phage shock protein A
MTVCVFLDLLQEIQTLQGQLDQHREQLSNSDATRMEIEAVREYRRTRQQQQQLDTQLKQLMQQAGQVC